MIRPELTFVAGCNAAGKSTFIRTRLNDLEGFKVLMTDVYKSRTKELCEKSIADGENVIIETVFNDQSFKNLVDLARNKQYNTSLIVLFLDSPIQSLERVSIRSSQQNGLFISGGNVKINFNESFKNVATYFFYFDRTDFIYTGIDGVNELIMSFEKGELTYYKASELEFPKKFALYSHNNNRLSKKAHDIILLNENFDDRLATN